MAPSKESEEIIRERVPRQLKSDQKLKQDLKVKITGVELFSLDQSDQPPSDLWELLFTVWMVNRHEAENAIEDYGLLLVLESGEQPQTLVLPVSEPVFSDTLKELDDLFASRDVPLRRAHPRSGVIRFRFKANSTPSRAKYELRIKDIYGLVHKLKGELP